MRAAVLFLIACCPSFADCKLPELTDTPSAMTTEALVNAGHYQRAKAALGNPSDAHSFWLLSRAEAGLGHLEIALKLAEQAVTLDPAQPDHHVQLAALNGRLAEHAGLLKQLGYVKRAKKELDTALELEASQLDALQGMVLYYDLLPPFIGGDKQKALDLADRITRSNPARGYLTQARLANNRKDTAAEESFYAKAIEADPLLYEARVAFAQFHVEGGHADAMSTERDACEAVRLDPGRVAGWRLLAMAEARRQCWDELFTVLDRAKAFVPDDAGPYYFAGDALLGIGMHPAWAEQFLTAYLAGPFEEGEYVARARAQLAESQKRSAAVNPL